MDRKRKIISIGSGFPVQKTLKGAYDTSWSKRGGGYNALSGRWGIIGFTTGKYIDYGIKNKVCKFCSKAEEKGQEPSKHDCRKNFFRFSKRHGATDLRRTVWKRKLLSYDW